MSAAKSQTQLTVHMLGRDYQVACPDNERESLLASAEYLSKRMGAIKKKGKTLGMERIAVMAALNMARDLIAIEKSQQQTQTASMDGDANERLEQLQLTVESALGRHK